MEHTNYEAAVKEIYPDATTCQAYTSVNYIPVGLYIIRKYRLFGLMITIFGKKIGHGFTEQDAWKNAFENLQNKKK